MKRLMVTVATFALIAAACTAGGGDEEAPSPVDTASSASNEPVTLEIWGAWTGRELKQFNKIFDGFTEQYPWITVNSTGGVNDQKIIASINSGSPPDVVLSFTLDNVGKFCESGAWQDLNPYIEQSGFDVGQFPPSVEAYTSFAGSRCAFPFLTDAYGLYYNIDMLEQAGISEPPTTLSELQADAKELTVFADDGSIEVAGFVPWFGYYSGNGNTVLANAFGADWYNEDATESDVDSQAWQDLFDWQQQFIADVYGDGDFAAGSAKLERFVAGAGDEWSGAHDFERGRVAMMLDGEWRTAFIADATPDLAYGTAPAPLPDDLADGYGRGQIGGTIIGIPKGSPHEAEAWLLLSYMATDTDTLVYMANFVRNVPTTYDALSSPDLDVTPQFQTFLDIFANDASGYKQPTAIGSADQEIVQQFATDWQAGDQTDLQAGLQGAAQQIDDQLAQAQV